MFRLSESLAKIDKRLGRAVDSEEVLIDSAESAEVFQKR